METIGGYRLIRRLGSGDRSDVYLGHAGGAGDSPPRLAAIKVFRPQVSPESIDAEISALAVLDHAHIIQLLDLATGPRNSPCLVLNRLEPGGLPRLFADRRQLEAGEAVTILAPIVDAVAAMHRAGVVHGRLGATSVLFDPSGAPVICGWGHAASLTEEGGTVVTDALLDEHPGVIADREALAQLARAVLSRIADPGAGVAELLDWLGALSGDRAAISQLEPRLFSIAAPAPVQFGGFTDEHVVPHRLGPGSPARTEEQSPEPSAVTVPGGNVDLTLPPAVAAWLASLGTQLPGWLVTGLARATTAVRSVRRGIWVVAGVGAVAMMAALIITAQPAESPEVTTPRQVDRGAPTVTPPAAVPAPEVDPVAAAAMLREERTRCLRDLSVHCLEAVHAPESAAWKADAARIHAIRNGGEIAPDPFPTTGTFSLVDRMGDTALLSLARSGEGPETATASVLLIRTEAGWRFRSLLTGSQMG